MERKIGDTFEFEGKKLQVKESASNGCDGCMAGEVGLSGELRPVTRIEQRIGEAQKLGFKRMIIPKANYKGLAGQTFSIEVIPVSRVEQALRELFG